MLHFTDARDLPRMVTLETCDFPIKEGEVDGYKVLHLPHALRKIFDEEGASVVRINSLEVAMAIPDFGGKPSGEHYSLLPHQDHLDPENDSRRFLMLSKRTDGARGSKTLVMNPLAAGDMLSYGEAYIKDDKQRFLAGLERNYDKRFRIPEEQYHRCFDEKGGYEAVARALMGQNPSKARERSVRLGLVGYLIRGSQADEIMQAIAKDKHGTFIEECWERGGVVIIDNKHVFHARLGGNTVPMQRNFCV